MHNLFLRKSRETHMTVRKIVSTAALVSTLFGSSVSLAQDQLPVDNGILNYHTSPRYRASEEHPLRIVGYVLHPIGWVAREVIFRPLSFLASSTEATKSISGFREPYDFREPECFSADSNVPDCRSLVPFNYDARDSADNAAAETEVAAVAASEEGSSVAAETAALNTSAAQAQVFFPDVNFDFNKNKLSALGEGRVHQLAQLLEKTPGLKIVLEGHTDSKGTDKYNQNLGQGRAETVKSELARLGVPADRIETVSFGESKPAVAGEDEWANAVNRRVAVSVAGNATADKAATPAKEEGWKEAK